MGGGFCLPEVGIVIISFWPCVNVLTLYYKHINSGEFHFTDNFYSVVMFEHCPNHGWIMSKPWMDHVQTMDVV